MREITFRGKRTDNGEWIYGVPTKDELGETVIVENVFECGEYDCRGAECLYVDENSIGQYTGLTDKNGTKIFEGDVVRGRFLFEREILSVVTFKDGAFGLEWNRGKAKEFSAFTSMCNIEYEVIGNIQDNHDCLSKMDGEEE